MISQFSGCNPSYIYGNTIKRGDEYFFLIKGTPCSTAVKIHNIISNQDSISPFARIWKKLKVFGEIEIKKNCVSLQIFEKREFKTILIQITDLAALGFNVAILSQQIFLEEELNKCLNIQYINSLVQSEPSEYYSPENVGSTNQNPKYFLHPISKFLKQVNDNELRSQLIQGLRYANASIADLEEVFLWLHEEYQEIILVKAYGSQYPFFISEKTCKKILTLVISAIQLKKQFRNKYPDYEIFYNKDYIFDVKNIISRNWLVIKRGEITQNLKEFEEHLEKISLR